MGVVFIKNEKEEAAIHKTADCNGGRRITYNTFDIADECTNNFAKIIKVL